MKALWGVTASSRPSIFARPVGETGQRTRAPRWIGYWMDDWRVVIRRVSVAVATDGIDRCRISAALQMVWSAAGCVWAGRPW